MRFSSLCIVVGLSLGLAVGFVVAADRPSFSGTWMLDTKASRGDVPEWSSLTVAEKGSWFRMAQNDKDGREVRAIEGECKTDNRFHPVQGGAGGSISCKWEGATLVTQQHWNDDRNERSMRTALAGDGELVQDIHETDAGGSHDAHLVWSRR
jgi:hypothetical protein